MPREPRHHGGDPLVEVNRGFGELDILQNDVRRALSVVEVVDELGDIRSVGSRFGAGQEDTHLDAVIENGWLAILDKVLIDNDVQ